MKKISIFRWLVAAALAASLPVEARAAANHTMGGSVGGGPHAFIGHGGGPHSFMGHGFGHNFGFHHDDRDRDDRFRDRDDRFFHHRHHFFFDVAFFGFPYWWYPYYGGYPYGYYYYDYGPTYDYQYWQNLATAVQTELARRGYYRGPIDGIIGSSSRQAIRAFQAANGLPATGLVDPNLLKALKLR